MARELTDKQRNFLDALFGEARGDFRVAMQIAGYSDGFRVDQTILMLREEIIERARTQLALESPKAVVGMVAVLEKPTELGNQHKLNAASQILDRVGIVKPEKNAGLAAAEFGVFILPPKDEK